MKIFLIFFLIVSIGCSSSQKKESIDQKALIYYSFGTQKLVEKRYTEALDNLLNAHKLAPKDPRINNNLGMAYFFKGDERMAIHHVERALEFDPTNSDARNNLASFYLKQKQFDKAKELYRAILKDLTYRNQFRTHYNLGLIALEQNQPKEAEDQLQKAIAEFSDYCPAYFELGRLYESQSRLEEAIKMYDNGSKGQCYEEPAPIYQMALVYLKLKNPINAYKKFSEIVERFPSSKFYVFAQQKLTDLNAQKKSSSSLDYELFEINKKKGRP